MRAPLQCRPGMADRGGRPDFRAAGSPKRLKPSSIAKLLLCAMVAFVLATIFGTAVLQAVAAPSFVTTQGSQFMYQGQRVLLRGENFNNEPALACCGGPDLNLVNEVQSDYTQAHQLGANVIRWGIDYNWYATNRTQFFSVLDEHMIWAAENQLWVYFVDFIPPGGSSGGFDQSAAHGYCIWS